MKRTQFYVLIFPLLSIVFGSCGVDHSIPVIEAPESYDFKRNGSTTVSFSGQTDRILMATELVVGMQNFDLDETTLLEMFANQSVSGGDVAPFSNANLNESTKSVKSKTAASADFFSANATESAEIKGTIARWISAQVNEVYPAKNELAATGASGQIADGSSVRYISAKGIEYDQAVNKSLVGALMLDQICNNYLSTAVLDAGTNMADNNAELVAEDQNYTTMEHKWDEAYGYLYGTATDLQNPVATVGSDDGFLNKYLGRVNDDSDFNTFSDDIFNAFKLGRAAIVAGEYSVRDEQAEIIRDRLSQTIGIRAVYYLQAGKNALANEDWGGAFHDLSEGLGFVYSLRFARRPNSNAAYFSRAEVDSFMSQLTDGDGFWTVSSETLDQISNEIADQFSFTLDEAAN